MAEFDAVSEIIKYEQGELDAEEQLRLFAYLIKTDAAWSLQGHYGRVATNLIDAGYITPGGEITNKYEQENASW